MQTNFDFLVQTDRFKDFAMQAAEAERSIAISPSTAAILSRRALELAVRWVYVHDDALTMPYRDNISSLIHEYSFRKLIQPKLFDMLKYTIKLGNVAVHTNTNVKHDAAVLSLRCVFQFCKWIDYCYGENYINRHYDMSLLPDAGKEKKTQEELENLQKELSGKDQKLEEAIKENEKLREEMTKLRKENETGRHLHCRRYGRYSGMDRYEARKAIVEDLEKEGYLVSIEEHVHNVGTHDRCKTTVEPMIKPQWFVKMDELAKPAINAIKTGELKFVPERFGKIYLNWLENIRDWCISRQLWWGHRIPAWTCPQCGKLIVSEEDPTSCPDCGSTELVQESDVLDTWFSSGLWPFSTLGWPDLDSADLKYWYPTSVMVTGYDIIFFWVARMIMAGYEYRGEKPFGHVYFTGIVRDKIGRKMSKQLGNSPDPLDLIAQFGADGMRVAMLLSSSAGNDVMFDEALCEQGRNFGNKIWNAYRLVNGWTIDDTLAQSENNRLAIEWFRQALAKTLRHSWK